MNTQIALLFGYLYIGLTTFGGGQVFIPMFKQLLVTQLHLLDSNTFYTMVSFANSLPSQLSSKLAFYTSIVTGSVWWALAGLLLLNVPGVIIMLLLMRFFDYIQNNNRIKFMHKIIQPLIIAILLNINIQISILSVATIGIIHSSIICGIAYIMIAVYKCSPIIPIVVSIGYACIQYYFL